MALQTKNATELLFDPLSNIAFSAPIGPLPYYNRIAARDYANLTQINKMTMYYLLYGMVEEK